MLSQKNTGCRPGDEVQHVTPTKMMNTLYRSAQQLHLGGPVIAAMPMEGPQGQMLNTPCEEILGNPRMRKRSPCFTSAQNINISKPRLASIKPCKATGWVRDRHARALQSKDIASEVFGLPVASISAQRFTLATCPRFSEIPYGVQANIC